MRVHAQQEVEKRRSLLIALGVFGLLLRVILMLLSHGTNDVATWQRFGNSILEQGLLTTYQTEHEFNHPPVISYLIAQLVLLSDFSGLPFSWLLKSPGILAEIFSAWLIYQVAPQGQKAISFAVFGLAPISILISGYHGNTDCIYAFLSCLSIYWSGRNKGSFMSGLILGIALNVKLIPLILLPVVLSGCPDRKSVFRCCVGVALGVTPFLYPLLGAPEAFLGKVVGYSPYWSYWGIEPFLHILGGTFSEVGSLTATLSEWHLNFGKPLILLAITALCFLNRQLSHPLSQFEQAACAYALFAVLAPSYAIQYFAPLPPLLCCFSWRWGAAISVSAGALALSTYLYFLESWQPLTSIHQPSWPTGLIILCFVAWITIIYFLRDTLQQKLSNRVVSVQVMSEESLNRRNFRGEMR